jgi:hypothetical protein
MQRVGIAAFCVVVMACSREYDGGGTEVRRPAYERSHPRVLIDQGHHNRHSIRGSYKPFAALLENDGYSVQALRGAVTAEALSRCELFVIPSALGVNDTSTSPAFSAREVEAVVAWVAGGGSLLLITDHYPFGSAVRDLARPFSVEMHDGMTFDPVHHDPPSADDSQLLFSRENGLLARHAITEGRDPSERVGRVLTFTGQSLRARSGAALLSLSATAVDRPARPRVTRRGGDVVVDVEFGAPVSAAGYAQAVALTYGRGRVVVFGEAAMATAQRDGGRRIGMNAPGAENRQFVLNTLHWLTRLLP